MKFDKSFIEERFRLFNTQMFGGTLQEVPIALSHARTYLGLCVWKKKRTLFGKTKKYDFRLRFSTRIDMPESELEDIIIHEMIHLYIGINNVKDTSAHGQVFRRMMADINQRFSRRITISHRLTAEQKEEARDKRIRPHILAVVTFKDDRMGIKVLPRTEEKIRAYTSALRQDPRISSISIFYSTNPLLNSYPCSAALRVHILSKAQLTPLLHGATKIEKVYKL